MGKHGKVQVLKLVDIQINKMIEEYFDTEHEPDLEDKPSEWKRNDALVKACDEAAGKTKSP